MLMQDTGKQENMATETRCPCCNHLLCKAVLHGEIKCKCGAMLRYDLLAKAPEAVIVSPPTKSPLRTASESSNARPLRFLS